jgi:hypothetical protein
MDATGQGRTVHELGNLAEFGGLTTTCQGGSYICNAPWSAWQSAQGTSLGFGCSSIPFGVAPSGENVH